MTKKAYWFWLAGILGVGLTLRLLIAFVPLTVFGINNFGFSWDLSTFADWMGTIRSAGFHAYQADPSINYPPVFADILGALNFLGDAFSGGNPSRGIQNSIILLKLPSIIADVAIAGTLAYAGRRWYSEKAALWAAGLYLIAPVIWYDSAIWGQVDSIAALYMLLAVVLLVDKRPELAAVATVFAILTKPQGLLVGLILAPILIGQLWRKEVRWWRLLSLAASAAISFIVLALPWTLRSYAPGGLNQVPVIGDAAGLWFQAQSSAGLFQVMTANAFNVWQFAGPSALFEQYQLGQAAFTPDYFQVFGIPAYQLGLGLFSIVAAAVFVLLLRTGSANGAFLGYAALMVAFFDLPTRVHERYLIQAFAILALVWAGSWVNRGVFVALSLANLINLHAILASGLQVYFPPVIPPTDGTQIYQHHGISPDVYGIANVPFDAWFTRDAGVILAVITVHALALGYLIFQLATDKRKQMKA